MRAPCSELHEEGVTVINQLDGSMHLVLTARQVEMYQAFLSQTGDEAVKGDGDLDPNNISPALRAKLIFELEQMPWGTEFMPFVSSRGKIKCLMCQ